MSILAVSGDVGGARALIGVLEKLSADKRSFSIIDNGFLSKEAPADWHRISAVLEGPDSLNNLFSNGYFKTLVFTSSVKDILPLQIARLAKAYGLSVIHLLDNWMNYRRRLEMDGQDMLLPDIYVLMDELAFQEACGDGIPPSILMVAGQPAMASLGQDFKNYSDDKKQESFQRLGLTLPKKLIVFISEPVEADQGIGFENPCYRGYTEKTVIRELCQKLQCFSSKYQLGIIPHPRDDIEGLEKIWQQSRGKLEGDVFQKVTGREAIFIADGVAGMASILLYEAWLINRPVISLQPGLRNRQLALIKKRRGVFAVTNNSDWGNIMDSWLDKVDVSSRCTKIKNALKLHTNATKKIAEIVLACAESSSIGVKTK